MGPDVLILCGGKGTRLLSVVADRPKSLAEVGDRAFLDILLDSIFGQGFRRIILAVGHMKEAIMEKYSGDDRILFSVEEEALGTGGAVRNAMDLITSEHFLVMNGDTYCSVDLKELLRTHLAEQPLLSMVVTEMDDVSDRGSVVVDSGNRIASFMEKLPEKRPGLVSAGVYVFHKSIKEHMPDLKKFDLEKDVFPNLESVHRLAFRTGGGFLDIGTPERYGSAEVWLSKEINRSKE